MKKNLNRLATLALSTMMAASMAMPAFAKDITLTKTMTKTEAEAYTPVVTYTYTATAQEPAAGAYVNGDNNHKVKIQKGIDGAVKINSQAEFKAGDKDGALTKNIALQIVESDFTVPGVYQYEIEEKADKQVQGLSNVVDVTKYKLLVFYSKDNGANKFLVQMGDTTAATKADNEGNKIAGLVDAEFKSHSITIEKRVTGNMGNKNEYFEFTFSVNGSEGQTDFNTSKGALTATNLVSNLKNEESVTIYGLTDDDEVTVKEKASDTGDYLTSIAKRAELKGITFSDGSKMDGTEDGGTAKFKSTEAETVIVENKRDSVTPTGIVMDIAPYLMMLGAAGGLGAMFVGKKKEDEE